MMSGFLPDETLPCSPRVVESRVGRRLSPKPVAAGLLQGVNPELWLLVGGGDAGVTEQVSHGQTVS